MSIEVKLNVFEGPLDLLLHLIEKNKFNIFDIPIVDITEQYLDYVNQMDDSDLDLMSEFLVMAGTLISIKAKMLLPKEEESVEEEDPRSELVRRLLEYKMYKYASYELKDMELDAEKSYYKQATLPKEVLEYREEIDPAEVVGDLTLAKLSEIFNQVMKRTVDRVDPIRSKFGTIEKDEVRVEDKMEEIRTGIKGLRGINFRTLLETQASKMNVIVTFLAVLELMKIGSIVIRQEDLFGEIMIDSLEM
ncbi:MAG: segregation/condensation protein A [Clostridium sp.]|nr:segregation/condensation protein A [Clostridium sp.]MCM1400181.1 segregation/condensation protein A [Clostridium sp.]MCM1460913.1 segregation/condensation protein A [Bacteroides sp.]